MEQQLYKKVQPKNLLQEVKVMDRRIQLFGHVCV